MSRLITAVLPVHHKFRRNPRLGASTERCAYPFQRSTPPDDLIFGAQGAP